MQASELQALLERVEKATGPDREIDCVLRAVLDGYTVREESNQIIARCNAKPHDEYMIGAIDPGREQRNFTEWRCQTWEAPHATSSLDAVLALVEEQCDPATRMQIFKATLADVQALYEATGESASGFRLVKFMLRHFLRALIAQQEEVKADG